MAVPVLTVVVADAMLEATVPMQFGLMHAAQDTSDEYGLTIELR